MVYFLARQGITDQDALEATILHDIHEDTDVTLDEIEGTHQSASKRIS